MTPEQYADWLAERSKSMGASDIAAAATGIYGGAVKAVASKLGIAADDIDPDLARRGHEWEQPIADGVLAHTGLAVYGEQMLVRRPDEPLIHVTLDGLLGPTDLYEPGMDFMLAALEIKTRGPHSPWQWDYWKAQCQVGMWCTRMPRALLAIATIDSDYDTVSGAIVERLVSVRYEWLDADPFEQQRLVDLGLELWAHVERGELPEPTDASALPYVKAANAKPCPNCKGSGHVMNDADIGAWPCVLCDGDGWDSDPTATADIDDLADLIAQRDRIAETAKTATDLAKTIEAKIRHRMGDAVEAVTTDGSWRVRIGQPVRRFTDQSELDFLEIYPDQAAELGLLLTVLDRDKAKAEMPEEYDALRIATPDRRLTTKNLTPEDPNP